MRSCILYPSILESQICEFCIFELLRYTLTVPLSHTHAHTYKHTYTHTKASEKKQDGLGKGSGSVLRAAGLLLWEIVDSSQAPSPPQHLHLPRSSLAAQLAQIEWPNIYMVLQKTEVGVGRKMQKFTEAEACLLASTLKMGI